MPIYCPKNFLTIEVCAEKGESLSMRGKSFDKGNTNNSKFERRKSNKTYRYCRKSGYVTS